MDTRTAEQIVEQLARWNVPARVVPRGPERAAVRVLLPTGREALWDSDRVRGLEAQVLRDGILVSYVPEIAGTRDMQPAAAAWAIATADYELSGVRRPAVRQG